MFKSPKRIALITVIFGLGGALVEAVLRESRVTGLGVLVGLLVGVLWGTGVFVRWTRRKSASLILSWYIVVFLLALATAPFLRGPEILCAAGGYGLAQLIQMQIWEHRHKKPIIWED